MDEQKEETSGKETEDSKAEAPKIEEPLPSDSEKGGADTTLLDEARKTAKEIKEGNEEYKKLLDKQEKLLADQAFSGRSVVGGIARTPEKKTDAEYAKGLMRGDLNPYKE